MEELITEAVIWSTQMRSLVSILIYFIMGFLTFVFIAVAIGICVICRQDRIQDRMIFTEQRKEH